jgi:hypothetical protein
LPTLTCQSGSERANEFDEWTLRVLAGVPSNAEIGSAAFGMDA